MKYDFSKMETEMDLLVKNMESITSFSEQISSTLQVNIISFRNEVSVCVDTNFFLFNLGYQTAN